MSVQYYIPNNVKDSSLTNEIKTETTTQSSPRPKNNFKYENGDGQYKKYDSNTQKKNEQQDAAALEAIATVAEYKKPCEANVVLCLYNTPDLYNDCNLSEDSFTFNVWRVYFCIFRDVYMQNKALTEDNIEFYLQQHLKLKSKYESYGGYATIARGVDIINPKDFESYLRDLIKWKCVYDLGAEGYIIKDKIHDFVDMSAEDIYGSYTGTLGHIFLNAEEKVKSYNACEGLDELNSELDKGVERGIPFGIESDGNFKILNEVTNGFHINGNIYGLGALSGVGKSTLAIQMLLPLAFREKLTSKDGSYDGEGAKPGKKIVFMVNEEDEKKFKREMEVWVINNILLKNKPNEEKFNKKTLSVGNFNERQWELLHEAARWLKEYELNKRITVIPLESYSASTAIKIIKKYAKLFGVDIFVLDTLKESKDNQNTETWKAMERDLVDLYNAVKPSNLNVGLFVTYQLAKQAKKVRYLTETEIGQAKNIIDVMSVNLMIRKTYNDEKIGGDREIKLRVSDEAGQNIDVPIIEENKKYMVMFINKNRFGETDPYQIVAEINQGYNMYQEIGTTSIKLDF